MIWFIIIFTLFFGVSLYFRKFNSPYLLTFLFGRKGAGKSSFMVKMMLAYKKRGWMIYTDLKGVNIPGVRIFDIRSLELCSPPPKSAVFLDEVGLTMDNRAYKTFSTGLRDWYALQRHYKCRVFVNSQAFDVDKKVRDRVDEFLFLQKIAGCITLIRPIIQTVTPNDMSNPNCDSPVSSKFKWGSLFSWRLMWLPKYAKYFDSFDAPARQDVLFAEVPAQDHAQDKRSAKKLLKRLNRK